MAAIGGWALLIFGIVLGGLATGFLYLAIRFLMTPESRLRSYQKGLGSKDRTSWARLRNLWDVMWGNNRIDDPGAVRGIVFKDHEYKAKSSYSKAAGERLFR